MELQMITVLEKVLPQEIQFNHEELKAELAEKLKKYTGLVVTEDGISDAKKDRALLNSFVTAIENKRIEVKKQCLVPYDDFEKKIKEIVSMVQGPIAAIDKQTKAFENKVKEDKTVEIGEFFDSNIGDLKDVFPLAKVWNPKWLNVGCKMAEIQKEISDAIFKVSGDLKIITAMKSEYELQMKDKYLQSFDMSAALSEKTRLEDQKAKLDEYNRKQAEKADLEARQNEQLKKATAPITETHLFHREESETPIGIRKSVNIRHEIEVGAGNIKTIKVIFYDTTEAFRAEMKVLTTNHNITYGGIE